MRQWRALPVFLAGLVWVGAGTGCTGADGEGETWRGMVQNTCGSAGGKAVFLRFGPVADTACGDPTTQASRYWIHRDSFQVESLAPGSIWVQELMQCHPDDCVTSGSVKLEISANLESEVRGSFEIREREGNSTKTRTGRAILKKCPMTQPGCF